MPSGLRTASAIIVIAGVIAFLLVISRPNAELTPPVENAVIVKSLILERTDISPLIHVYGEITAGREGELRAQVDGRIVTLHDQFRDGVAVVQQTVLAEIDPEEFEIAVAEVSADLDQARALLSEYRQDQVANEKLAKNAQKQVEISIRNLERAEKLARIKQGSEQAKDDASLALAQAEQSEVQARQAVTRAKSRIAQQRAAVQSNEARLARAERDLRMTKIIAPFDGYVTDVNLALGKAVGVGETLGRIIEAADLEVRFNLPEADYGRLLAAVVDLEGQQTHPLLGASVQIIWKVGDTELSRDAQITRVGAEIDAAWGGIELFATLAEDASVMGLRPGAFVDVLVPDIVYRGVYSVPERALDAETLVYQIIEGRTKAIEVNVLRDLGGDIIIDGPIPDRAEVVAERFPGITDGARVRPVRERPSS
ncbi:MAG: efflux RND transporter periplasmic adaptor subunit [Pseudomonadota bacterium]